MEFAETSRNDSAQSPGLEQKGTALGHLAEPGGQVARLAGEDERRPLGERLLDCFEVGEIGPVGLLHRRQRPPGRGMPGRRGR
jgi:hypothetical protein